MPTRSATAGQPPASRFPGLRRLLRRAVTPVRTMCRSLYYRVHLRLPVKEDLAVYAAYWYRGYACNPRAIYEKAAELVPDVRGVWVVKKMAAGSIPPGVDYVVAGSLAYLRLLARAKYFINNCNFPGFVVKRRGTLHLLTQHGTPLKAMGLDLREYPAGSSTDFAALLRRVRRWDLMISANPLSSRAWRRAFPGPYELLEIGYPRNDQLINATGAQVHRIRTELGIRPGDTAVLYAPTHRDGQRGFEPALDIGKLMRALGPRHVLLLRAHYFYNARGLAERYGWPAEQVIDVSRHPSVEEVCLASDALVTDYSSVMFDYVNLDRPIVIHAPDWDRYRDSRGVYFDLLQDPPGPVATDTGELIEILRSGAASDRLAARRRATYRHRFCPWDDGNAAERVVRRLFGTTAGRGGAGHRHAVAGVGATAADHGAAVADYGAAAASGTVRLISARAATGETGDRAQPSERSGGPA